MENNRLYERYRGIEWFKHTQENHITIVGAGGIGSHLTLHLAGLKPPTLFLLDNDTVEKHNRGGGLFANKHLNKNKVTSVAQTVKEYKDYNITALDRMVVDTLPTTFATFLAVDSLKARKKLFELWKNNFLDTSPAVLIDGRIAAEQLEIYVVIRNNQKAIEAYEKSLEGVVAERICTQDQTSFIAGMVTSYMTAFYCNYIANIHSNLPLRRVPFSFLYNSELCLTETKFYEEL